MAKQTGELWAVIQEWMDAQPFRVSQRQLADKLELGHSTVTEWKYRKTWPKPDHLKALAAVLQVPYERVLNAALIDRGYRDAPAAAERESS